MPLSYSGIDIPELIINKFPSLEAFIAAQNANLIGENDISLVDENLQADWLQSDSGADDYIKNKPNVDEVLVIEFSIVNDDLICDHSVDEITQAIEDGKRVKANLPQDFFGFTLFMSNIAYLRNSSYKGVVFSFDDISLLNGESIFIFGTSEYDSGTSTWSSDNWKTEINAVDFNRLINKPDIPELCIEISYNELRSKMRNHELTIGQKYRINDYITTTNSGNNISTDTYTAVNAYRFDLIVTATSMYEISYFANAIDSTRSYYRNSDLSKWQIWYDPVNDLSKYDWTLTQTILAGISSQNSNGSPLKRLPKMDGQNIMGGNKQIAWGVDDDMNDPSYPVYTEHEYLIVGDYGYQNSVVDGDAQITSVSDGGKGVIYRMIDEWGNDCPYDFKNIQFKRNLTNGELDDISGNGTWVYTFNAWDIDNSICKDASLVNDLNNGNNCIMNVIESSSNFADGLLRVKLLPNNVFLNRFSLQNSIQYSCFNNKLGEYNFSNTFGDSCSENIFEGFCFGNILGDKCMFNKFGYYMDSNKLGNLCTCNTFKLLCGENVLGDECAYNEFDAYDMFNNLSTNCSRNKFSTLNNYNTLGTNCYSNTFKTDCTNNTFGHHCHDNLIESNCQYIIFGNNSGNGGDYIENNIIESGNKYIRIYNTVNSNHPLKNIYIAQGINTTSPGLTISTIDRNLNYRTTVGKLSNGTIRIYNEDEDDMVVIRTWTNS